MIKKNKRNTISLIFIIALVVGMALLSFQLRKTQGFVPTPVADEISPKVMFTIGPVQVTSTVVNTWVMIVSLGIASFFIGRSLKIRPGMLQNALEWLIEAIQGIIKENIG